MVTGGYSSSLRFTIQELADRLTGLWTGVASMLGVLAFPIRNQLNVTVLLFLPLTCLSLYFFSCGRMALAEEGDGILGGSQATLMYSFCISL